MRHGTVAPASPAHLQLSLSPTLIPSSSAHSRSPTPPRTLRSPRGHACSGGIPPPARPLGSPPAARGPGALGVEAGSARFRSSDSRREPSATATNVPKS